jgi:syntaxin-binding protein 1
MGTSLICSSLDKVRIIALYILFREGVADEDRRRLYQHARLSISEQDTINNLIYLGIRVIKVSQADGNEEYS